jgi:pyruvate kinase
MNRRTKIVATIGPASDSPEVLRRLIDAGMDVARISLAHDKLDGTLERYRRVRAAAKEADRVIGILVDLPGPKVRAGAFPAEGVLLEADHELRLVPGSDPSSAEVIHVGYDRLLADVEIGDRLAIGDGSITMEVIDNDRSALKARIRHGGRVRGRPGIHIPSDRLRITSPTPEDLRGLDAFVDADVDMVALSMVRSAHDIRRVGTEPHPRGPLVIAKIETRAAVENLEGIIDASGGVMVARGDLGNECPIAELPHLQKRIIKSCIAHGRPVITATQMLESMIHAPSPTRAEATDVANAIFDGSSAVMLSAETAIGHDPVLVVQTMAEIAARADSEFDYPSWAQHIASIRRRVRPGLELDITDTMTMAGWRAATEAKVAAIIAISHTGFTVRAIARFRPEPEVLAFSPDERAVRQLTLSWGITPFWLSSDDSADEMVREAMRITKERTSIRSGDVVAVLHGSNPRVRSTDVLRLARVP